MKLLSLLPTAVFCGALVTLVVHCAAQTSAPAAAPSPAQSAVQSAKKYATPAEVVAAAQAARASKDWGTWVDCISPAATDEAIGLLLRIKFVPDPNEVVTPGSSPAEKKAAAELDALFIKSGLTDTKKKQDEDDNAFVARMLAQIKDKRTFWIALMKMSESDDEKGVSKPQLEDVKIDGDHAEAKLATHDSQGNGASTSVSFPVKFRKIDGSWRIDGVTNI